jgi:hypothetical protein
MSTVVDTPEGIAFVQMLAIRGRLQLEDYGMRSKLPTLKRANQIYGTNYRTRKQMIEYLNTKIEEAKEARRTV